MVLTVLNVECFGRGQVFLYCVFKQNKELGLSLSHVHTNTHGTGADFDLHSQKAIDEGVIGLVNARKPHLGEASFYLQQNVEIVYRLLCFASTVMRSPFCALLPSLENLVLPGYCIQWSWVLDEKPR